MANVIDRRDGVSEGLAAKRPCRVATTANITLSGTQTIDGVAVAIGDRVLVRGQTTGADNGIYVVANGSWIRAADFDGPFDIVSGTTVFVTSGSTYGQTFWYVVTADDITIGTTALTFAQWSPLTATQTQQIKTSSGSVTVAATDSLIAINKTVGAATTVTLPLAASKTVPVKVSDWKGDAGTNNITINVSGSDKLNGNLTSWTIAGDGASLVFSPLQDGSGYAV